MPQPKSFSLFLILSILLNLSLSRFVVAKTLNFNTNSYSNVLIDDAEINAVPSRFREAVWSHLPNHPMTTGGLYCVDPSMVDNPVGVCTRKDKKTSDEALEILQKETGISKEKIQNAQSKLMKVLNENVDAGLNSADDAGIGSDSENAVNEIWEDFVADINSMDESDNNDEKIENDYDSTDLAETNSPALLGGLLKTLPKLFLKKWVWIPLLVGTVGYCIWSNKDYIIGKICSAPWIRKLFGQKQGADDTNPGANNQAQKALNEECEVGKKPAVENEPDTDDQNQDNQATSGGGVTDSLHSDSDDDFYSITDDVTDSDLDIASGTELDSDDFDAEVNASGSPKYHSCELYLQKLSTAAVAESVSPATLHAIAKMQLPFSSKPSDSLQLSVVNKLYERGVEPQKARAMQLNSLVLAITERPCVEKIAVARLKSNIPRSTVETAKPKTFKRANEKFYKSLSIARAARFGLGEVKPQGRVPSRFARRT